MSLKYLCKLTNKRITSKTAYLIGLKVLKNKTKKQEPKLHQQQKKKKHLIKTNHNMSLSTNGI